MQHGSKRCYLTRGQILGWCAGPGAPPVADTCPLTCYHEVALGQTTVRTEPVSPLRSQPQPCSGPRGTVTWSRDKQSPPSPAQAADRWEKNNLWFKDLMFRSDCPAAVDNADTRSSHTLLHRATSGRVLALMPLFEVRERELPVVM